MNIDQVYNIIQFVANKNSVGYLGPEAFNTLFNIAQDQVFNDYMDGVKGWASVGPNRRTAPGDIGPNTDSLAPFKTDPTSVAIDASGNMIKPANLIYLDAMYKEDFPAVGKVAKVTRVEGDRYWSFVNSVVDPVGENPIYTEFSGTYKILPKNLGSAIITYYRMPVRVVWGFTIVSNRPVYNPATSVNPEWGDDNIMKILMRMCFNLGIRLKDQELTAYSRIVNNEGE